MCDVVGKGKDQFKIVFPEQGMFVSTLGSGRKHDMLHLEILYSNL